MSDIEIAIHLKGLFNEKYGQTWNAIVSRYTFAASLDYIEGCYINFVLNSREIALYKSN
jgi:hypothetical protein